MELLTNSRMKSFRSCPRRHFYEYVEGVKPVAEDEAMVFGTLVHTHLERYWLARRDGVADPASVFDLVDGSDLDPFVVARLRPMLLAYAASWSSVECGVLAIEREFRLPLVNPRGGHRSRTFELSGKIDLVLRLADGRIAIVDHKTSGESIEPGSEYRRRLVLDGQLSQYWRGCEALGWVPDVGIWDVLGKPKLSPYKATPESEREYTKERSRACAVCKRKGGSLTAPHFDPETSTDCVDGRVVTDPGGRLYASMREFDETADEFEIRVSEAIASDPSRYLAQIEVQRLDVEREQYDVNVWHLASMMREARGYGSAIYNPDACMRGRKPCPYLDVCEGTASINDPSRFKRERIHSELSEQTTTHAA
jgi:hypothetical protein